MPTWFWWDGDISWTLLFKMGDFSWTFSKGDSSWTLLVTFRGHLMVMINSANTICQLTQGVRSPC